MLRMNSVRKKRTDKTVVKEHIVLAAAKAFADVYKRQVNYRE